MTLTEFNENITSYSELINVCYDEDLYDQIEDLYSDESRNELIDDDLRSRIEHDAWYEISDWLCGIPTGYDFYRVDEYGDWTGLEDGDDYFFELKDQIRQAMDDNGLFDEEEEEEADSDEEECGSEEDDLSDEVSKSVNIDGFEDLFVSASTAVKEASIKSIGEECEQQDSEPEVEPFELL